jgi:primosomal protein N' (replication factor Y)
VRARQENIPIVLGSATPSLESLHNAYTGRYGLLRLNERAGGAKQPRFLRLDVKSRPLDSGISGPMQQAIGQTLAPASKCWCSSTAAASHRPCCATIAAGCPSARAAMRA